MKPSDPAKRRAATLSRRKRRLFIIAALLLPVLLVLGAEGLLRLLGHGGYDPVLRRLGEVDGGELILADQAGAISYFFANPTRPGYNHQYQFIDPKPAGTFRVFVVGESAAKGFPQPRNLAAPSFLERMLTDAWPERKVEVINLGTTAVASFPVLGMLKEALEFDPDLVIIHTGHNEFFGAYGVNSASRGGTSVAQLKLTRFTRGLAITQALGEAFPSGDPAMNKSLMEIMVGRSHTPWNDASREAAAGNLGANVGEMLRRCGKRGVPAIVCTLPTNERDLFPVGEDLLDASRRDEFRDLLEEAELLLPTDSVAAAAMLRKAVDLQPHHARAQFLLGRALLDAGEHGPALERFIAARDLDTMPWRATSRQQDAIREAAGSAGGTLCELEEAFRDASPGGCIGWELMDDHVHPSLEGQALMADALVDTMRRMTGAAALSGEERARIRPAMDYAEELGDNPWDRYGVDHSMRVLFRVPFLSERNAAALERFEQRAAEFERTLSPELKTVVRKWQSVRPHAGGKRPITGMVARQLMRERRFEEAHALYRIARRSVPPYTSWHIEYVYFALVCRHELNGALSEAERELAAEEIERGDFLLRRGFSGSGLTERYMGRLHQLRDEWEEAIPFLNASRRNLGGMELVAADQALFMSLLKTQRFEEARQLAENGVENSGEYAPYYRQLMEYLARE